LYSIVDTALYSMEQTTLYSMEYIAVLLNGNMKILA
jgi:hypothetical protein